MHFTTTTTVASALLLATTTLAQDIQVRVVNVGRTANGTGGLAFDPEEMTASPGEMIQFQFWPQNHSVVQSTFSEPCMPITFNQPNATGLYSGFMPVSQGDAMMPTYTIMVNDTAPIWLYCSQGRHCQGGMSMVINPPQSNPDRTLAAYKQLAGAAPENLSPGQMPSAGANGTTGAPPTSGGGSGSGSGGVGGGSPEATNAPPSPSESPAASVGTAGAGSKSLYAGSSAALAVLSALAFFAL